MAKTNQYQPCLAIPPGETLAEMLEDRCMPQNELATRTGVSPKHINEIIQGKAAISHGMALRLETVLGVSASFWNNLETNYRETLARLTHEEQLAKEATLASSYPYNYMAKAGYVAKTKKIAEKARNLLRFFSVSSLETVPALIGDSAALRKADNNKASIYALSAWIRQCEIKASEIHTADYDRDKLLKLIPEFRQATFRSSLELIPYLQQTCADCGVALVILPQLQGTYANGVSKWLTPKKALVAVSPRGRRADIFWFTFFHELGHLLLSHSKKATFISFDKTNPDDVQEQEANRFAADHLIPPAAYKQLLTGELTTSSIEAFAHRIGIHPGIVAGRLCNDRHFHWKHLSELRVPHKIP